MINDLLYRKMVSALVNGDKEEAEEILTKMQESTFYSACYDLVTLKNLVDKNDFDQAYSFTRQIFEQKVVV